MIIDIEKIKIDGGTQPRCSINEEIVSEYAEAMKEGAEFPPIVAFYDGIEYWLADGFHRTHACRRAGLNEIDVDVQSGTSRDAILYSVGANSAHGQRRTNADKRKAVMTLLDDSEWSQWSDSEIARRCAVHHSTVAAARGSLAKTASDESRSRTYTTRHGTTATMNTANIGKSEQQGNPELKPIQQSDKKERESRGVGLDIAHQAIKLLHSIPRSDGLRDDAFNTVIDWIETNR